MTQLAKISDSNVAPLVARDRITALGVAALALPAALQGDLDELTGHHFAPGVYARTFLIPEGDMVVGKIHKTEHLNIICQGRCTVATEDGTIDLEGPVVFTSRPGAQKAVYAHTATTWVTIHVTEETDPEVIEKEVIAESYEELAALGLDPTKPLLENK